MDGGERAVEVGVGWRGGGFGRWGGVVLSEVVKEVLDYRHYFQRYFLDWSIELCWRTS